MSEASIVTRTQQSKLACVKSFFDPVECRTTLHMAARAQLSANDIDKEEAISGAITGLITGVITGPITGQMTGLRDAHATPQTIEGIAKSGLRLSDLSGPGSIYAKEPAAFA